MKIVQLWYECIVFISVKMRYDIGVYAHYWQCYRRFSLKNTPKIVKIVQKSILPMSQKSRDRKWVNKVGDLKSCIGKLKRMDKKMQKEKWPQVLQFLLWRGGLSLCNTLYIYIYNFPTLSVCLFVCPGLSQPPDDPPSWNFYSIRILGQVNTLWSPIFEFRLLIPFLGPKTLFLGLFCRFGFPG